MDLFPLVMLLFPKKNRSYRTKQGKNRQIYMRIPLRCSYFFFPTLGTTEKTPSPAGRAGDAQGGGGFCVGAQKGAKKTFTRMA
jgi:hypothetical protein